MPYAPVIVPLVLLLLALVFVVANFNRFIGVRQHLRESWADIDVEMKRRYELIPNLVACVKGYTAHEQQVLTEVTQLRTRASENHGTPTQQAVDETALAIGMRKLFAVAEGYPQLKSDTQFLALQTELANTEDRIAAARRFYNGNVREMNQMCDGFPSNLIGGLFGFERADYFELASEAERVVPRVGL
ncbi:LemA family protein [Adhaeretor mobilis]|uniref:LemA family protein n=1 Tax=Adhaeretor mobilis TaxID=1930276 RepID=A0A517N3A2_9BACT|nr:LemA family protein [Adhaeretor mobilis]QDT01622.1 LemA family protein [Adhaeretor mobilis]